MIDYNDFKLWDEFLSIWTPDKIKNMTLNEYTSVDDKTTFTYWLEHTLRPYGSIRGGSAEKFGIFKKKNMDSNPKSHLTCDENYTWNLKYGKSPQQAFELIRSLIIQVIQYIQSGNLSAIENIDLAYTLKWKIAFHFQNREKPLLVAIFNEKALQAYFHKPTSIIKASEILKNTLSQDNLMEISAQIWNEWDKLKGNIDYEKVEQMHDKKHPLNQILYGPPGTGKTYHTINTALSIIGIDTQGKSRQTLRQIFDEKVEAGQIVFTTFHQSTCYEDFIEGIKPILNDDVNKDNEQNIEYQLEDGIFKLLCETARPKSIIKSSNTVVSIANRKIWKMSLGNTNGNDAYIYDNCINNNYVLLGYGYDIDFSSAKNWDEVKAIYEKNNITIKDKYDYQVSSVDRFKNEIKIGDLIIVSDGNRKFRAIAEITSDYYFNQTLIEDEGYSQARNVIWHRVYKDSLPISSLFLKNLSQMTLYRLGESTIDLIKLQSLLSTENENSTKNIESNYTIESVSNEIIKIRKPNGSLLPMPKAIVDTLANYVLNNTITIDDIKQKKVFDKIDSDLEKFLVRGYPNILAMLVENMNHYGSVLPQSELTNYVLIIDEINRGNVSQIFGELITLIEDDKRLGNAEALTVTLPYSKTKFGVPNNLYIIGTMNTADRSVEALDTALRRRFSFTEMLPKPDYLIDEQNQQLEIEGVILKDLLTTINQRIELLLDRDHQIGHSYFMNIKTPDQLCDVINNKVIPLLQEYFFNDYAKIGLVLGKDFVEPTNSNVEKMVQFADFEDSLEVASQYQERKTYQLKSINKDNIIAALDSMKIEHN